MTADSNEQPQNTMAPNAEQNVFGSITGKLVGKRVTELAQYNVEAIESVSQRQTVVSELRYLPLYWLCVVSVVLVSGYVKFPLRKTITAQVYIDAHHSCILLVTIITIVIMVATEISHLAFYP